MTEKGVWPHAPPHTCLEAQGTRSLDSRVYFLGACPGTRRPCLHTPCDRDSPQPRAGPTCPGQSSLPICPCRHAGIISRRKMSPVAGNGHPWTSCCRHRPLRRQPSLGEDLGKMGLKRGHSQQEGAARGLGLSAAFSSSGTCSPPALPLRGRG